MPEVIPTKAVVECQASAYLERIGRKDAQLISVLGAIGKRVKPRAGESQPEQKIRVAVSSQAAIEIECAISALRYAAVEVAKSAQLGAVFHHVPSHRPGERIRIF